MPPKSKSNKKKKKCVESKPPALECTLADPPPSISRLLQDLNPLNLLKTVCAHPGCTAPAHKKCSVCEGVRYCSKAHQTLNWQMHKLVCEPVDKQINHGTRFDTPEPSPHANPTGLWYKADSGGSNAGLKSEYIMGNAGMMQELQMLAWRHRGLRPVILIETLAGGEDAHDPRVTLVPESEWRKKEEYQPPGSIDMPYPIAELVRQVDVNKNFFTIHAFCTILNRSHLNLCDSRWNTNYHAQRWCKPFFLKRWNFPDKHGNHFFTRVKISNNPIFQWSYRFDIFMSLTLHHCSLFTHSDNLASRSISSNNRWTVHDNFTVVDY